MPFQGKAERLTEEIYRILKEERTSLTPYDMWKLMIPSYKQRREPPPGRTVVSRRVSVLAERSYLEVARLKRMPSGLMKKYYESTEKFHSAKRLHDMERRKDLADLLTETIRFDEEVPEEAERLLRVLKS